MTDPVQPSHPRPISRSSRAVSRISLVCAGLALVFSVLALVLASGYAPGAGRLGRDHDVRAYLLEHPEVIVEAMTKLEARQTATENDELTSILVARREELLNDPTSPTAGNSQGDATLVEFFDYNCPYCRKASPVLERLAKDDTQLRIVFKEFPVLGSGSVFAAKAALASQQQGKYNEYHKALMSSPASISETSAIKIAGEVGLDVERLKADMSAPAIDEAIKRNLALAEALRISGTPTFVSGAEIVRGLVDADTLKGSINRSREATR